MSDEFLQSVAHTTQKPWGSGYDGTHVFMQWKGTDVCCDFTCECGHNAHIHAEFMYTIECPSCGAVWEMPSTIYPRRCDGTEFDRAGMHIIAEDAV